jgi:predicted ATPase/DNA-binding SARP family transcriptional activator
MSFLALHFLGPPLAEINDTALHFKRRKVLALLVYLAITSRRHSRGFLTDLLYPKQDRIHAQGGFRRILSGLKSAIGDHWLKIDLDGISFCTGDDLWIDVFEFRRKLEQHRTQIQSGVGFDDAGLLKQAVQLYRGEFLSGFYLKDSTSFDEWQFFERERLQREYEYILERLVNVSVTRRDITQAIRYANQLLSVDPLSEEVHCLLIRLYMESGHRSAALRQYETCRSLLEKELQALPDDETTRLFEEIRSQKVIKDNFLNVDVLQKLQPSPVADELSGTADMIRPSSRRDHKIETPVLFLIDTREYNQQSAIADLRAFIEKCIISGGGDIVSTPSDIINVVFSTCKAAIATALEAQIRLQRGKTPIAEKCGSRGLAVAIYAAEAEERGAEGLPGWVVRQGSHILDAAHTGQILLSSAAARLARKHLPQNASLRYLGSHRLKGLDPAQVIYQLQHPSLFQDFPALKTLDTFPNNLRSLTTRLIGRERAISDVIEILCRDDVRILTMTGAGGTGKTRLAVHAAAKLIDRFEDGVYFVDLSSVSDHEKVVSTIAGTLGIRESRGQDRPISEVFKDYLKNKQMLLLLDNFENVVPAAGRVTGLLSECPDVKMIITSRVSLHIPGVREYEILPLSLPDTRVGNIEVQVAQSEAVQLFVDRARIVKSGFTMDKENASVISEICLHLDGLPLAIELAASRLKVLAPKQLLKRIAHRFKILTNRSQDLPPRQQTLLNTIDWSYNLLDDSEKRLFTRLSVFAGGCSVEAAEQVCSIAEEEPELPILDGLTALMDKSLLRQYDTAGGSRFWMLESIKEHSRIQLEHSLESQTVSQRHACYFLEMAEETESLLHGPDQVAWLDRWEIEYNNLQDALSWFLSSGEFQNAFRLALALEWFWYRYGYFSDGRKWLEEILDRADGDRFPHLRARAYNALGWIVFLQGNWLYAKNCYSKCLELSRQRNDKKNEVTAVSRLGVVERWLGELEEGTIHGEEAIRIGREIDDPLQIAYSLICAYATTGGVFPDRPPPRAELEEALSITQQTGDLWSIAHILNGLGDLFRELGDYCEARIRYEESLRIFRELKDRWMIAWTLEGLGRTCYLDDDYSNAEKNLREGVKLFSTLGDKRNAGLMLFWLGMVKRSRGCHGAAARLLGAFDSLNRVLSGNHVTGPKKHCSELNQAFADYRSTYMAEWVKGQAMTLEDAISFALTEPSDVHSD